MDGSGGLAVQLLVEDGFEQRLERRRQRVEPEGEGPGAIDEDAEFGVAGAKVGEGFVAVEGKLAGAAVVDHGISLRANFAGPSS